MPSMTLLVDGTIPVAEDFNGNFRRLNQALGVSTGITSLTYSSGQVSTSPESTTRSARLPGSSVPSWSS